MAFCSKCGARIENGVKFCPGCGNVVGGVNNEPVAPVQQQQYAVVQPQGITASGTNDNSSGENKALNIMALIGFITGVFSWFLTFWGITGVIACIFSGIGLAKFNPETEKYKWMAVIGLVAGVVNIIYAFISNY